MKRLQYIPYILLFFSILISTIISIINRISFTLFLKRTFLFLVIIFFSAKIFVYNIVNANTKKNNHKDHENNKKNSDAIFEENSKKSNSDDLENDDFKPLDFKENKIEAPSKIVGSKIRQS